MSEKNKLYYGDNYEVLKMYLKDESVDLIYLDPPFNSRQDRSTYPRIQILSIQEILEGKQPDYPRHRADATFKKAPVAKKKGETLSLWES